MIRSTQNSRPVLPGSLRFIRSDVPNRITPEEMNWLLDENIRTIIDLRTEAEQARKPCPLARDERFDYLHLPVTGGDAIPPSPEAVPESYIRMADTRMQEIVTAALNVKSNVLYFCNAGKDRTGVLSAILQKHFGLDDEYILDDYVASGINLKPQLEAFAASNPAVDLQVITPKREYMERFLEWYDLTKEKQADIIAALEDNH